MLTRKLTALVLGNAAYQNSPLTNAVNDAEDIANSLGALGFTVSLVKDATVEEIDHAVSAFKDSLNSNDVGLFYFAGHGMQIDGENYIIPINNPFTDEACVKHRSYSLGELIEGMSKCSNQTNIIILDACRDNPLSSRYRGGIRSTTLAPIYAPKGTLISFSTSPGEKASDGSGRNGLFTESLLKHISTPDLSIEEILKRTRNTLSALSRGKQTSWEHTSLTGNFYFKISLTSVLDYSKFVIADKNFHLLKSNPATETIKNLRSYNWYKQNAAIGILDKDFISSLEKDALFLLGRNIYQAAVGGAHSAIDFIDKFVDRTDSIDKENVEYLLNGIIFEIFFNKDGEIREHFKLSQFNNVFSLLEIDDFKESFRFIHEILLTYSEYFYVVPGRDENVTLDIKMKDFEDDTGVIEAIFLNGNNILKLEDGIEQNEFDENPKYSFLSLDRLKNRLSESLVIPKTLLNLNFLDASASKPEIYLFPRFHTLQK